MLEQPAALADIEKKVGLQPKVIMKVRYIKPINRRKPDQRMAHIILTFNTKESTNQAIKFRLMVTGKKVYARKLITEPSRCLKCHSFEGSHMAKDCPEDVDTCGTCSGLHWTSECTIKDQNQFFCINCNIQGHAAWSRECLTFNKKWNDHKNCNAEANYQFYLTDDPLTWERTPNPDADWYDQEATRMKPQHPQQEQPTQRYPPPREWEGEWRIVERQSKPHNTIHQNPNTVPLGGQTRITDIWNQQLQSQQMKTQQTPKDRTNDKNPKDDNTQPISPAGTLTPIREYSPGRWSNDQDFD
jgi:hypothetical protein